jgi:phosphoribosylanthranilate isomerase
VLTQIYGITTVEDAVAVDHLAPDHIGVVVNEGIETWDSVEDDDAVDIARSITTARLVALSLSTRPERIMATARLLEPAVLHLARAVGLSLDTLAQLRADLTPIELMLTVPVTLDAVAVASRLAPFADYLLLDSAHPTTGVVGATGLTHDWSVSARIVAQLACPVVLAGGLGPHNVAQAIHEVGPAGVDSETRTSRDGDRRRKDPHKVEAFIENARKAAAGRE